MRSYLMALNYEQCKIEYCSYPVSLNTTSTYKKIITKIINY